MKLQIEVKPSLKGLIDENVGTLIHYANGKVCLWTLDADETNITMKTPDLLTEQEKELLTAATEQHNYAKELSTTGEVRSELVIVFPTVVQAENKESKVWFIKKPNSKISWEPVVLQQPKNGKKENPQEEGGVQA